MHPTAQLLRLVTVNFICCIGGENRKQCEKKLSLSINSSNRVEMSVWYIKDNERNLVLTLCAQPAQVLMCEITQGEKT